MAPDVPRDAGLWVTGVMLPAVTGCAWGGPWREECLLRTPRRRAVRGALRVWRVDGRRGPDIAATELVKNTLAVKAQTWALSTAGGRVVN